MDIFKLPENNIDFTTDSFAGTVLSVGYVYHPDPDFISRRVYWPDIEINWLGYLVELGLFGGASPESKGIVPFKTADNNIIPVKYETTLTVSQLSFRLGPKIAIWATNREYPWTSSHIYFIGGSAFYRTVKTYQFKLTMLDAGYVWGDTNSRVQEGLGQFAQSTVGGFFGSGTALRITDSWHFLFEWSYLFGFKSSELTAGVNFTF